MKKILLTLSILATCAYVAPAAAEDFSVTADMQRCTTNEDCGLISNDCSQNCGFVGVNKAAIAPLQKAFSITCAKNMETAPCPSASPMSASCVTGQCVASMTQKPVAATPPVSAPAPVANVQDYKAGAYNVSEPADENKVKGDYTNVEDRDGKFSAYNLPQDEVKQKNVGQIIDKIYVPADAPVTGEQYVPVAPSKTVAPTPPVVQKPVAAPVAAPAPTVTAPVEKPVTEAPKQALPAVAPAPTPTITAPTAPVEKTIEPSAEAKPLANVPTMTPSKPNQLPPGLAPVAPTPAVAPIAPKAPEAPVSAAPTTDAAKDAVKDAVKKEAEEQLPIPTTPDAMPDKGAAATPQPTPPEFIRAMEPKAGGQILPVDAALTPMMQEAKTKQVQAASTPAKPVLPKSFSTKKDTKQNEWN